MIQIIECCMCQKMSRANLIIGNTNICARCEQKIIEFQGDNKEYSVYKDGIKKIFTYDYS